MEKVKLNNLNKGIISTGYAELDNLLGGGFKKGELIIVNEDIGAESKLTFHLATRICDSNNAVLLTLLGHEEYSDHIAGDINCCNSFVFECGCLHLSDFQKHIQFHSHLNHICCACVHDLDNFISEYNISDELLEHEIDDAYISAYHLKQIARIENIPIIAGFTKFEGMPHLEMIDEVADIVLTGTVIGSNIDIRIDKFRSVNLTLEAENRKDQRIEKFITGYVDL